MLQLEYDMNFDPFILDVFRQEYWLSSDQIMYQIC